MNRPGLLPILSVLICLPLLASCADPGSSASGAEVPLPKALDCETLTPPPLSLAPALAQNAAPTSDTMLCKWGAASTGMVSLRSGTGLYPMDDDYLGHYGPPISFHQDPVVKPLLSDRGLWTAAISWVQSDGWNGGFAYGIVHGVNSDATDLVCTWQITTGDQSALDTAMLGSHTETAVRAYCDATLAALGVS